MSRKIKKVENIDFKAFVDIFNTQGKDAAAKHVTDTYGVKYDSIVNRLRRDSEYTYEQSRGRYVLKDGINSEEPFLTVEELCNNDKIKDPQIQSIDSAEIISNLIKDKFFEISKYVTLENSSKKIILNLDAARNDGYGVEYV